MKRIDKKTHKTPTKETKLNRHTTNHKKITLKKRERNKISKKW